jgi:hypothetical protein
MANDAVITAARLREILHYDPETGVFTWRERSARKIHIGDIAGTKTRYSYLSITIEGRRKFAHCWAWLYMTGQSPSGQIDHKNMVKDDNRWGNLRLSNKSLNGANSVVRKSNPTGVKGVHLDGNGYRARVKYHGREIYLGHFTGIADAAAAYARTHRLLFGEFSRT